MLQSLRVWNFALLEEVAVEFGAGLNILTGETGAGKSILIDALGAILGQRVSSDAIRSGADALRVEAVFSLDESDADLCALLSEQEIECEDELIVLRKIARTGKGSILVNGSHVTLTFLKKIAPYLVDIHGQNENLALLREDAQRNLLEGGDSDLRTRLAAYTQVYADWKEKTRLREERAEEIEDIGERLELLRWQEKEIAEAELTVGEDEELETEIRRLSHAERLVENAAEAANLLSEDGEEGLAVLSALARVTHALDEVARYDDALANAQNMIEEAYISLQEAVHVARRLQITENFFQTPLLSCRQRKWQCSLFLSQHFFRPRDSESLADILGLMLQNLQLHLKIKKFFKLDSTQGLLVFR